MYRDWKSIEYPLSISLLTKMHNPMRIQKIRSRDALRADPSVAWCDSTFKPRRSQDTAQAYHRDNETIFPLR